MSNQIIEKVGILFGHCIYIEGIIKDLIIFKQNPSFIPLINSWWTSIELNQLRKEIIWKTFTVELLDDFFSLYPIDDPSKKQLLIFRELRDIYGHSRIWKNHDLINHVPYVSKFEKRAEILWLKWEWWVLKFNDLENDFDKFMPILSKIEDEFFPQICKEIWLDYEKIK